MRLHRRGRAAKGLVVEHAHPTLAVIDLHAVHRSGQSHWADLRRFLIAFAHRFFGGNELPAVGAGACLPRREAAQSCPHRLELHQHHGGKQIAVETPGDLVEFAVEDARDLGRILQMLCCFVSTIFLEHLVHNGPEIAGADFAGLRVEVADAANILKIEPERTLQVVFETRNSNGF